MPRPMPTWARARTLTAAGAHLLRRMRAWLPGRAGDGPAPQRQAADVIRQDERERVLTKRGCMTWSRSRCTRSCRETVASGRACARSSPTSELSAAWPRLRIEELDQLITQHVATVDWHLRESCRLRQLSGAD